MEGGKTGPAACPPAASRVKLRPAPPALDPAGRRGGRWGGVRRAEGDGDLEEVSRAPARRGVTRSPKATEITKIPDIKKCLIALSNI